jgi:tyrosinase
VSRPDTFGTRRSIYDLMDERENGRPEALDALMTAWKGIQDREPDDPSSFFVIGGYHGEPFRGYSRSPLRGANGDMGENDTAALDPVFYFHHCFIDYVFWTWQRRHGATQWFDIDPDDPGSIATPPNAQTPAGRGQNEQLSMDSPLNPFRVGEGPAARVITSRDVVDIGALGYQRARIARPVRRRPDPAARAGPGRPGERRQPQPDRRLVRDRCAREIDGEKHLIGHEAVLSRRHVAGCANCRLHLESKAAFPVPPHLHELARSRPEAITVSVHTRRGLHGGAPIPAGAHVLGANTPFKVELHH